MQHNIVTSHGYQIAAASFELFRALYQSGIRYQLRESQERDPITGEITEQVIVLWQGAIHIMTDTQQDTPQPQPDTEATETPAAGEGDAWQEEVEAGNLTEEEAKFIRVTEKLMKVTDPDAYAEYQRLMSEAEEEEQPAKSSVDVVTDVLYADPQARIRELEAQNAAHLDNIVRMASEIVEAQKEHDKIEKDLETVRSRHDGWKERAEKAEAELVSLRTGELQSYKEDNERLREANAKLTEKLKVSPDAQIGVETDLGETIARLQAQVHELQRQLREKQASRLMTTEAPAIGVYEVVFPYVERNGKVGRLIFEEAKGDKPKTVNGDKFIQPGDTPVNDELAAMSAADREILQGNQRFALTVLDALNQHSFPERKQ